MENKKDFTTARDSKSIVKGRTPSGNTPQFEFKSLRNIFSPEKLEEEDIVSEQGARNTLKIVSSVKPSQPCNSNLQDEQLDALTVTVDCTDSQNKTLQRSIRAEAFEI